MKKFEVLQEDKNDCGAACLSSIIKYYNGYLPLEDIRNLIKTDKLGTNAYDLVEGAKIIGFDSIGKQIPFTELKNIKSFPLIAHVKKDNHFHFIVIYDINLLKNKALIMDPALGLKKVDLKELELIYHNTVILFSKVKELPKLNKENYLLKVIIKTLLNDKRKVIFIAFMSLFIFILNLSEILFYKYLFDKMSNLKILYILLIIVIQKNIITFLNDRMFIKLKYNLEININEETLDSLLNLPYSYFKNKTTGEIVSRVNDLDVLRDLFLELITNSLVNLILILSSLFIIAKLDIYIFLITLIVLILYLLTVLLFKNKYKNKVRLVQENKGHYNNDLIETLEAIESINNLGIKSNRLKHIKNNYKSLVSSNSSYFSLLAYERSCKGLLYDFSFILIIFLSLLAVVKGKFTLGEVMLVYMLYSYFMSTIKSLIDKIPEITFAFSNLEKVNQLLVKNKLEDNYSLVSGTIKLRNLTYERNDKILFKNLTCEISERSKVFIKGQSGTGKSTLLKTLLKYNTTYNGDIYLENTNYKEINSNIINNSFTYIGQNEKLFSGRLIDNLTLERDIDKKLIDEIIKLCEVDEIINKRKLKEDFYIEENGFNLSGGERQRIILARGLLKTSNFILIDEALSEVEVSREIRIIKNILKKYEDKTIIYVSHKLETSKLFDKIIDIERRNKNDQGRVTKC